MTVSPRNLEKALLAQQELVEQNPRDARAYNDLGNLLVLAGDLVQAEQAYLYALELEPGKVSTRFNLALLLQQTGRFRDALEQYREVLHHDPNHAWTHYQVGSLYDFWEQDDLAIDSYARAFSLDPQLAFPEINPHVIDNRLLTEALLKAHRTGRLIPAAPKAYDDPVRIGQLLIPPIPTESGDAGDEDEDDFESMEDAEATALQEGQRPQTEEAGQLLTDGDLDPNAAANQAAPPSGRGRGSVYRPPSRVQRAPRNLRQLQRQPTARNQPQVRPGGGRPLGNVVGRPQPPQEPPDATDPTNPLAGRRPGTVNPGGQPPIRQPGFRPGTPSTGRLDLQLTPVGTPRPAEELAAG